MKLSELHDGDRVTCVMTGDTGIARTETLPYSPNCISLMTRAGKRRTVTEHQFQMFCKVERDGQIIKRPDY